jgi:hypothetical protein
MPICKYLLQGTFTVAEYTKLYRRCDAKNKDEQILATLVYSDRKKSKVNGEYWLCVTVKR